MNKSVLPTLVILILACIMVPLVSAAQGASTDSSTIILFKNFIQT